MDPCGTPRDDVVRGILNGTCLFALPKLESRIHQLSCEQSNVRQQNQQLRGLNTQLQQQLEGSREKLQATLGQLRMLEHNAAQEQDVRQR